MVDDYGKLIAAVSARSGQLRKEIPEVMQGFGTMAKAACGSGTLDEKTKELVALALSVGARCDPCIGFHAKALVRLGATRAEVQDVLGLCVYMGGGPGLMYAAAALAAWEEFGGARAPA